MRINSKLQTIRFGAHWWYGPSIYVPFFKVQPKLIWPYFIQSLDVEPPLPRRQEDDDAVPLPKGTAVKAVLDQRGTTFGAIFLGKPCLSQMEEMQIECFVLSGKTFRFMWFLYQGIWKIGREFGGLSLRSPARAGPWKKASTSIHCVLKHILLRINKRVAGCSVWQRPFSHFEFPDTRPLGTSDSTMHLAVAQPGSQALMNSPNLKGMQPWHLLLAKYGKMRQQPGTVHQHVRHFQLIASGRTCRGSRLWFL